jgi:hypothetical protein
MQTCFARNTLLRSPHRFYRVIDEGSETLEFRRRPHGSGPGREPTFTNIFPHPDPGTQPEDNTGSNRLSVVFEPGDGVSSRGNQVF